MIFKQVSLDDLMAEKLPSFSATIAAQNEAEVPSAPSFKPSQKAIAAVYAAMAHGRWMSKAAIAHHSGVTEHGVSARLSDLKKLGIASEKRKAKEGSMYEYRLLTSYHETEQNDPVF